MTRRTSATSRPRGRSRSACASKGPRWSSMSTRRARTAGSRSRRCRPSASSMSCTRSRCSSTRPTTARSPRGRAGSGNLGGPTSSFSTSLPTRRPRPRCSCATSRRRWATASGSSLATAWAFPMVAASWRSASIPRCRPSSRSKATLSCCVSAILRAMGGFHGRVLFVDLTPQTSRVETIDPAVYRDYLAGYGLGAWLMWKHFPPGTDPLAPEACFAICAGLLTGLRTPFSSRIQLVGKSPLTGTWADSNSGGSVCTHLRAAGFDAKVVTGRAAEPTVLVVRDGEVAFEPAGELWGQEIPPTFDALKQRFGGKRDVGVSAIGPAGEKQQRIASVMNDRYHAFGRQDVRRPDYETRVGFGANLLNDDLELVTACHDACNRYGIDAVSSSMTLGWVCEAVEKGLLTAADLDGIDMRWGNGEAALALTIKMGTGDGCGAWLGHGVQRAAEHVGKGTDAFAVHIHGGEPAYHDSRFTSLMGVTYIADPTPGRHTAGGASWNETFGVGLSLPKAADKNDYTVKWKGTEGKGKAQALHSNAHQAMNGLGLCMFTMLTGHLPWTELVNGATGWDVTDADLLTCGERIQNLRAAFNWREGLKPADFKPHPRMLGEGDDNLGAGPLKGVRVPLPMLRDDYYTAMHWNRDSGMISKARATELGMADLLAGYVR